MKITICGSIAFFDEMLDTKEQLENHGHEVEMPPSEVQDGYGRKLSVKEFYRLRKDPDVHEEWIQHSKRRAMRAHFDKIARSDAILVLNLDKNGIAGYVGSNTFLEMGVAFHLNKRIYLINGVPEMQCQEEIGGMQPVVLHGDLSGIKLSETAVFTALSN